LLNEVGYDKAKDETQIGNGFETTEYIKEAYEAGKGALGFSVEDKKLLELSQLKDDDIVNEEVDNDYKLSPELNAQVVNHGDGEMNFGETPENTTALDDARAAALKEEETAEIPATTTTSAPTAQVVS
jgi:hypothetical protein